MTVISSRPFRTCSLLLLAAALQVTSILADVSVSTSLADQLPPLAHANQAYNWQFLSTTFDSGENQLSYSASGLPDWADLDSSSGLITGTPPKRVNGKQTNHVTITASDGSSSASSSYDMVTINAVAPTLTQSLQDQLPKAASMGQGNTLPNKTLHLPLGWSFSIGFQGDTFRLPDDDKVYYSTYLEGAKPLPSWLIFNEEELTYGGIAPTDPGPNGETFNVILFGSNMPNTGGPSSNFTIYVAGNIITMRNIESPPVVNITEGQPFSYTVPSLNTSNLLLDGKNAHSGEYQLSSGTGMPSWVSFDTTSGKLTGTPPFNAQSTNYTKVNVPLQITHPNAKPMDYNVTLDVYPSAFNTETLPNATVSSGHAFEVDLAKYYRNAKESGATADFASATSMSRRDVHLIMSHTSHMFSRRSLPSWAHFDSANKSLTGTAPDTPQDLLVTLSAPSIVANAPVSGSSRNFTLFVRQGSFPETAPKKHGLSPGEKGAIAGAILGAALLAAIAACCVYGYRRRRRSHQAVQAESMEDAPMESSHQEPVSESQPFQTSEPTAETTTVSPYIPQSERHPYDNYQEGIRVVPTSDASTSMPHSHEDAGLGAGASTATAAGVGAGIGAGIGAKQAFDRRSNRMSSGSATVRRTSYGPKASTTQINPPGSPEWQRADEDMNPTPFLAQSSWKPTQWTNLNTNSFAEPKSGSDPNAQTPTSNDWEVPLRRRSAVPLSLTSKPFTSIDIDSEQPSTAVPQETQSQFVDDQDAMPKRAEKRASTYSMSNLFGGIASATGLAGLGLANKQSKDTQFDSTPAADNFVDRSASVTESNLHEEDSDEEPEVPQPATIMTKLFGRNREQDEEQGHSAKASRPPSRTDAHETMTQSTHASSHPNPDLPSEHASWEDDLWYGERSETARRSDIPACEESPRLRHASGTIRQARSHPASRTVLEENPNQTISTYNAPSSSGIGLGMPASTASKSAAGLAPRVTSQNWVRLDETDTSISYLGPIENDDDDPQAEQEMDFSAEQNQQDSILTVRAAESNSKLAPPLFVSSLGESQANLPEEAQEESALHSAQPTGPISLRSSLATLPPVIEEGQWPKQVESTQDASVARRLTASPMEPGWDTDVADVPLSPVRSSSPAPGPISAADVWARSPPEMTQEQFAPWQYQLFSESQPKNTHAEPKATISSAIAPQLGPVPRAGRIGPLPQSGTPQLSPVLDGFSPLTSQSARFSWMSNTTPNLTSTPTMPMNVEPQTVPHFQPEVRVPSSAPRPNSLNVEPQDMLGVFDDADNDPIDPFAEGQYPYGTVLGQSPEIHRIDAPSSQGSLLTDLGEINQTEGALAQNLSLDENTQSQSLIPDVLVESQDAEPSSLQRQDLTDSSDATVMQLQKNLSSDTPQPPPTSSTMDSIQLAQSRSVNFTSAKPPRLQLISCRPDEAISLPLISSQVSFSHHMLDQVTTQEPNVRYEPQLFAPSRVDLHGRWPSWLSWLTWDPTTQELTGTVPKSFASEHRLPMQLPIHILLIRDEDRLTSSTADAMSDQSSTSTPPLIVARILLTILPAAEQHTS
ncbi:polarity establishment/cellular polarization [Malassezia yamatoensis]|uniref:Polarity establishment/cellular polarization n=1 Tax=Malassezia yamatoensis TaxID=253288 RepID=A0AAJ5YW93_9BASI|nr:polarity establishment/cellular polarization [Malassezia yamatoensis]